MSSTARTAAALACAAVFATACAGVPARELPIAADPPPGAPPPCLGECDCDASEALTLRYLGASGFVLERGTDQILLGPFFSHVSLPQAGPLLLSIGPDVDTIHRYLGDVSGTQAILVGHAHYDHLLDVPHIARHHARRARIYLSETGASILAADRALDGRVEAVDARGWSAGDPTGHWIDVPGSQVRILPILSEHAPHFHGLKFMSGHVDRPRDDFPRTSGGWKEGQTFAFLIEFLDDAGDAAYRIYYQDASTNGEVGMPPANLAVDVALPCVASFEEVSGHPETLATRVAPRHLLLSHWEDFFRPYTQDPDELRAVRLTDVAGFLERLHTAGFPAEATTLPVPGQSFRYRRCPR